MDCRLWALTNSVALIHLNDPYLEGEPILWCVDDVVSVAINLKQWRAL